MLRAAHTVWPVLVLALACDSGTTGSGARPSSDRDARASYAATGSGGTGVGDGVRSGSGGSATSGGATATSGGKAGKGGATEAGGGAASSGGNAGRGGTPETGGAPSSGGAAAGGTGGAGGVTYATSFDQTESPISESGAWHHDGLDWTRVDAGAGRAFGTQALGVSRSGPTGYDDSYAHLSGFPPDQRASAVVALGTIDASCTHEVEILLRWTDSAHSASGYECNVAWDGAYAQIVRWNGPVGDYTYLGSGSVPGGMHDGDTVSASIIGDQLTLSVNGVVRATAQDSTFPTGNPGIGFWRGMSGCGTSGDYGFSSYSASSVP